MDIKSITTLAISLWPLWLIVAGISAYIGFIKLGHSVLKALVIFIVAIIVVPLTVSFGVRVVLTKTVPDIETSVAIGANKSRAGAALNDAITNPDRLFGAVFKNPNSIPGVGAITPGSTIATSTPVIGSGSGTQIQHTPTPGPQIIIQPLPRDQWQTCWRKWADAGNIMFALKKGWGPTGLEYDFTRWFPEGSGTIELRWETGAGFFVANKGFLSHAWLGTTIEVDGGVGADMIKKGTKTQGWVGGGVYQFQASGALPDTCFERIVITPTPTPTPMPTATPTVTPTPNPAATATPWWLTATPVPGQPTPTAVSDRCVRTTGSLNARSGPGTANPIVKTWSPNQRLQVWEQSSGWMKVGPLGQPATGWSSSAYLVNTPCQ